MLFHVGGHEGLAVSVPQGGPAQLGIAGDGLGGRALLADQEGADRFKELPALFRVDEDDRDIAVVGIFQGLVVQAPEIPQGQVARPAGAGIFAVVAVLPVGHAGQEGVEIDIPGLMLRVDRVRAVIDLEGEIVGLAPEAEAVEVPALSDIRQVLPEILHGRDPVTDDISAVEVFVSAEKAVHGIDLAGGAQEEDLSARGQVLPDLPVGGGNVALDILGPGKGRGLLRGLRFCVEDLPAADPGAVDDVSVLDKVPGQKGRDPARGGPGDLIRFLSPGRIAGQGLVQYGGAPLGTDGPAGSAVAALRLIDRGKGPALGVGDDADGLFPADAAAGKAARALVGEADQGIGLPGNLSGPVPVRCGCPRIPGLIRWSCLRVSGLRPDPVNRGRQLPLGLLPHLPDDPVCLFIGDSGGKAVRQGPGAEVRLCDQPVLQTVLAQKVQGLGIFRAADKAGMGQHAEDRPVEGRGVVLFALADQVGEGERPALDLVVTPAVVEAAGHGLKPPGLRISTDFLHLPL